jgi:hypothetical protein
MCEQTGSLITSNFCKLSPLANTDDHLLTAYLEWLPEGSKQSRADIEPLLAIHDRGHEPVYWSGESRREQDRLDLCGADLRYMA